ncbi:MAG TPA: sigma-70 family RNA polymerase sigma factor [Kribbella sp.]|nr:sigma-70 family RNA polymerase sigma factor [Kribbella sp.]
MTSSDTPFRKPPATTELSQREQRSAEAERLLRRAARERDPRRSELLDSAIVQSAPMARTLAARYDGRGVDTEDLVQVAYVGLVKAARGYRPDSTTDFRSYAIPTIRGELKRHFRDNAWTVRPPRRIQDLQAAINAAESVLVARLHRWPSHEELAEHIGVPAEQVADAQRAQGCFNPLSLDAPVTTDSSQPLGSMMSDQSDTYVLVDQVESLRPAVAKLADRDQLILRRRFVDYWTQAEIAAEIGVSQMQVSRLLQRILTTLRSDLAA